MAPSAASNTSASVFGSGTVLALTTLARITNCRCWARPAGSEVLKPKPKYYPDWRRNHSKGFLTIWFVLFVALVGTEWGLRRLWGLI